jgi:magnesium chelatase family protein
VLFPKVEDGYEFSEVVGQKFLVRGLQIAAAGGHNLLAIGAPGCGKTMALQKFRGLLPLLTVDESHPVTRIMSLAGQLPVSESVVRIPPFRMPHQTATIEGMCGGGVLCRPGEI